MEPNDICKLIIFGPILVFLVVGVLACFYEVLVKIVRLIFNLDHECAPTVEFPKLLQKYYSVQRIIGGDDCYLINLTASTPKRTCYVQLVRNDNLAGLFATGLLVLLFSLVAAFIYIMLVKHTVLALSLLIPLVLFLGMRRFCGWVYTNFSNHNSRIKSCEEKLAEGKEE